MLQKGHHMGEGTILQVMAMCFAYVYLVLLWALAYSCPALSFLCQTIGGQLYDPLLGSEPLSQGGAAECMGFVPARPLL